MTKGLSTKYIDNVLYKTCKYFKGTFSSNNIPPELKTTNKFSIVCNLSKSTHKGSHWIVIIGEKYNVHYIDSMGLPCLIQDILIFLNSCNRNLTINSRCIQPLSSIFCGFYSIYCVLYYDKNNSITNIFNLFSKDVFKNDKIVIKQIIKLMKQ